MAIFSITWKTGVLTVWRSSPLVGGTLVHRGKPGARFLKKYLNSA
ncbi:hypothetical protein AB434_2196 [Heyndrickxia coagulans]|uniref:Uncharacterized protein n=1 Tax=Heyndrickxia coagulans TaxID=1398 RepID=A0AAN0T9X6_HEYCO|nr:hypothetical protein SB48_HM08orf04987 [Heyndrickxia coagulans]AKN54601.1 hypothetical protein AB434_2196 [Heyndrickxia coagulans]